MKDWLLQAWQNDIGPALFTFLGVIVASTISMAAARFTQRTGIEIEAKHREALHSAIMSGVRAGLTKFGGLGMANNQDIIAHAVDYAKLSVPDAIGKLKPSPDVLAGLAASKLAEARTEANS